MIAAADKPRPFGAFFIGPSLMKCSDRINKVLARRADLRWPEQALMLAIIQQAITDFLSKDEDAKKSAKEFIYSDNLESISQWIDITPNWIRRLIAIGTA